MAFSHSALSAKWSDTVGEFAGLAESSTYAGESARIVTPVRALLQICAAGPDWVDGPSQRGRRWCGWHDAGQRVQGPAVHGRGDPVGRALVSDVPDQLPRSRTDAAGPRGRGRPHDPFPLDPGLCAGAGEADPAAPTPEQRLVAGR